MAISHINPAFVEDASADVNAKSNSPGSVVTTSKTALPKSTKKMRNDTIRNLVGFWLLGLSNNYAYVIMLCAAHDILSHDFDSTSVFAPKSQNQTMVNEPAEICNPISTGLILILDILPSLIMKAIAPFVIGFTNSKMWFNVIFQAGSFLMTGLSTSKTMAYTGVVFASLASGLGEVTLLGYMSKFDSNMISTWSSGTGAAGFFGSLSYLFLTWIGMTPRSTILVMLVMPVTMWIAYFFILVAPSDLTDPLLQGGDRPDSNSNHSRLSFGDKLKLIKLLAKFMIPIGLVYLFEYFINQGLFELIQFRTSPFDGKEQYRFYQADYQLGVLISRSSVNLFRIHKLWILPVLQGLNVVVLLAHILHPFLPSFWAMAALVLFEGLLGGWAYVNTYTKIKTTDKIPEQHKEFSMSVTSLADTLGIAIAGFSAIPAHNFLCDYMKHHYH